MCGIFSHLLLRDYNYLPILKETKEMAKMGKGCSWLFSYLAGFLFGGAGIPRDFGRGGEGLGLAPLALSLSASENGRAVAHCGQNSPPLLEHSPVLLLPCCGCTIACKSSH